MLSLISLQRFYKDHIDPDGIQPMHALRTTIAAILAMIVYRAFDWPQAYWIVFSAILILQSYNSPSPQERWRFLIMTGSAATVCTFIASLLCNMPYVLPVFLMITTFVTVYLNVINTNIGSAAFYVNFFCLSAGALPVNFIQAVERSSSVFMGFLIAVTVCLFLWPDRLHNAIRNIILENLSRLNEFKHTLSKRSHDKKAISIRRNRLMRGFKLARRIIPPKEIQSWQMMRQIEYLYEIILMLHDIEHSPSSHFLTDIIRKDAKVKYKKSIHTLQLLMKQKGYRR